MNSSTTSGNTEAHLDLKFHCVRWRIRRIVFGFDRSEAAIDQLSAVSSLVSACDAELLVVHSVPAQLPTTTPFGEIIDTSVSTESVKSGIEATLKQNLSCAFRVFVGFDSPDLLIGRIAADEDADLIIVGTRGRNSVSQFILGSVSQSLLSNSYCPVLIFGPESMLKANMFGTVLFATDLDATGLRPAQYAGALASDLSCRLILMHVMSTKPRSEGRLREWTEEKVREVLFRQLDREARSECNYEDLIAYGDPGQEILAAVDIKAADLVIMGAGTQSPIGDHASWRTLSFIVRNARCPVLVVGPDSKEPPYRVDLRGNLG